MKMKKIGVFTSGGDAPGMNTCLRAVVRTALNNGLEIVGIKHGYVGMIEGDIVTLTRCSVSNIIHLGGTIIGTGRSKQFMTKTGRKKAALALKENNIDALICIGGDGSFHGLDALWKEWKIPAIGIPGTIDNDLYGTDNTIGYDTAMNTALSAVDKIRDTASSHDRTFLIEVMGRQAGFIGLNVGIAGGAEEILIPEVKTDINEICKNICGGQKKGKSSFIFVVSEGDDEGGAIQIGEKIKKKSKLDFRVTILGHIQRGGNPSLVDRVLACKLGYESVIAIQKGRKNVMVGEVNKRIVFTPIKHTWTKKKHIDKSMLKMASILSQ